jgi:hypothetical protein
MKTASIDTATDAQYGELKTMFERTARGAVPDKDGVQNLLGRWDKIGPLIASTLVRYGSDLSLVDSALLEPITMVSYSAVESFKAAEKFAIGTQDGVVVGWLGDNFEEHFLGNNETNVPAGQLRVHRLRKASKDPAIIAELGDERLIETNLATVWELMKKQGVGQAGDLLVNGYANIFYIRADNGVLWAVNCYWCSGNRDWDVIAIPITSPGDWSAGFQFFSR